MKSQKEKDYQTIQQQLQKINDLDQKLNNSGIDNWKIPLSKNDHFLEDTKRLVDAELIAERLLGNELKRD